MVYIQLKTETPDMVGKGGGGAIGVKVCVTNGATNVLWYKILRKFKTKKGQNTIVHTST